jgi:hypothetical protein
MFLASFCQITHSLWGYSPNISIDSERRWLMPDNDRRLTLPFGALIDHAGRSLVGGGQPLGRLFVVGVFSFSFDRQRKLD